MLLLIAISMSSCYKQSDVLEDLVKTEGKHFPVIATFTTESGDRAFTSGKMINLDLRYWSVETIESVTFTEVIGELETVIATNPYQSNFSADSQTDKMIQAYTTPTVSEETSVTVRATVKNTNGLTKEKSLSLTIMP